MNSFEIQAEKFAEHARQRWENGEHIATNAHKFKVCAGCFSIFYKRAAMCCFCHGYRWYETPDTVKLIAFIAQKRPIPFIAGVAPRLTPVCGEQLKLKERRDTNGY